MKSARERAAEHIRFADDYEGSQLTTAQLIERLAESFKEHVRDQRQNVAEAVHRLFTASDFDVIRDACMNAPAPGEEP